MGVRAIFQLETPWSESMIFDLGYEQAADVMVFTHLDTLPVRLTRYAHDNWTLAYANYLATVTPPAVYDATATNPNTGTGYVATEYSYVVTTIDAATGQESLNTGGMTAISDLSMKGNFITIDWTAVAGAERYNVYKRAAGTYGFIGTTEQLEFIDDNILPDTSNSYPRPVDPFAGENNQPAVVAFWQQRAMYARTYNKPNGIWGSQSANLFNFNSSRPTAPDDGLAFAVAGRRVNAVMHLVPLKNLIVFTTDAVFSIKGGQSAAITPTDIDITPEGYRAASRVRPAVVDDIIFFHTAKGGSIRTLGYQFEADGYKGNDLGVFVPQFFENVFAVDMTWAEFPLSVLAVPMSDGDMRVLTWQAEQQVWGWSKWATAGRFESVCTVSEGGEDVLYAVVKRGEKRYLEFAASTRWVEVEDAVYLDSALVYEGDPRVVFGGLRHLEGQTVDVLADGAVVQGLVVMNGQIELDVPASKVIAGLPYESWIRTLPLGIDELKGEPKIIAGATVKVKKSRGLEIGIGRDLPPGQFEPVTSDDEIDGPIDEIKTRNLEPPGEPPRLFTGNLDVDAEPGDWQTADVVVRQRYPLPMTVLGITPEYALSE